VTDPEGVKPFGQAEPAAAYPVFVAFSDSPGAKGPGGGGVVVVGGGVVGGGVTVCVTVCVSVTVVVGPGTVCVSVAVTVWVTVAVSVLVTVCCGPTQCNVRFVPSYDGGSHDAVGSLELEATAYPAYPAATTAAAAKAISARFTRLPRG
jgi:hypothetical protein